MTTKLHTNGTKDNHGPAGLDRAAIVTEVEQRGGTVAPDPPSTNGSEPEVVRELRAAGVLETDQERREREQRNPGTSGRQTRSRCQWAIGALDENGGHKTFLQVVTLSMKGDGGPSFVGRDTYLDYLSASKDFWYRHRRQALDRGQLKEWQGEHRSKCRAVTVRPTKADASALARLQSGEVDDPAPYAQFLELHGLDGAARKRVRFAWRRGLRDSDLDTVTKGIGLAASLLWNRKVELYRRTTGAEIATLSGYGIDVVEDRLDRLDEAGWLFLKQESSAGDGNGTWLWPRIPDRQVEAVKREYL